MKETLESIVVAFILAFVFRAFIVEAFVIPTGSMAPTLYGVHGTQICQDCGTSYAYGLKEDGSRPNTFRVCPNCRNEDNQPAITPKVQESGDRILVLKWPFDIGGAWLGPKRWEVVVFKTPSDGKTNYIKRLIGLPNEVLEIIDGNIYTAPVPEIEKKDPELLDLLEQQLALDAEYGARSAAAGLYGREERRLASQLEALADQIAQRLGPLLTIRRKSETAAGRRAQQSLWLPVLEQDYLPHRRRGTSPAPAWIPQGDDSPWDASGPEVVFSGSDRDERVLRFESDNGGSVVDTYAYNLLPSRAERFHVGELRLRFILELRQGEGYVRMSLGYGPDRFVATLHQNGKCEFQQLGKTPTAAKRYPAAQTEPLVPGQPVSVEFSTVDYHVTLRVGGRDIVSTDYASSRSLAALRNGGRSPSSVEIAAARADLVLRHVSLQRDVYYQKVTMRSGNSATANANHWDGRPGWGVAGHPILLRPKEYFVLGDNSPQSADSRLWGTIGPHLQPRGSAYQAGTVPADQLIGHAFFVYWPSGLRLFPSLPIRLVPNVGEMRWIR